MTASLTSPAPTPPTASTTKRDAFKRYTRVVTEGRLNAWRIMGALLMVGLSIWLCWEAWAEIVTYGTVDMEYSHILLVPFVALFLIYVRRKRLRHFGVRGTWLGPLILLTGLIAHSYGLEHNRQFLFQSGAVIAVLGAIVSFLGKNALFRFMPAVLVLAFMVPMPNKIRLEYISLPLQQTTAQISHFLFQVLGMDTIVRGNTLEINGEVVIIAEACNGMRLVFPLFLIAFAFTFGMPLRNSVRLFLLLLSPIVALACNVIRTMPNIWLYGKPNIWPFGVTERWVADEFHNWSGWAMLPIAFLALLGIIKIMRWMQIPVQRYTLAAQ
jgi:exosortase